MRRLMQGILCGCFILSVPFLATAQVEPVIPDNTERLESWGTVSNLDTVHASIEFNKLLDVDQTIKFVNTYGLVPYAVHMSLGDQVGVHRVDPELASLEVINNSLINTRLMKEKSRRALKNNSMSVKLSIRV